MSFFILNNFLSILGPCKQGHAYALLNPGAPGWYFWKTILYEYCHNGYLVTEKIMKLFRNLAMCVLTGMIPLTVQLNAQESIGAKTDTAIFAGGCFWCMEPPYDGVDGVLATISGYSGGHSKNPTYKQVSSGKTGHTEVIQISFDPTVVSYEKLLQIFWRNIDPTRDDGQFCDRGNQYRPAIFYLNEEQHQAALSSLEEIELVKTFADPIKVEITAASEFYPAEEYHQDYYLKNPLRYKYYRYGCGRDKRLEKLWGKKSG